MRPVTVGVEALKTFLKTVVPGLAVILLRPGVKA